MIKSILAVSLITASGVAMAHSVDTAEGDIESGAGYISVGGSVLKTGTNDCLHAGTFSDSTSIGACEGEEAAAEPAEPTAEAKPAPKPLKAKVETANLSGVSLFNTGSDALNAAGLEAMEGLYSKLDAYKGVTDISVIGHTDSRGTEANNLDLSERRAANIAALLQARYGDAKIVSKGMGESSPIASNDTAEGRQQNRRVEVQIKAHRMIFN